MRSLLCPQPPGQQGSFSEVAYATQLADMGTALKEAVARVEALQQVGVRGGGGHPCRGLVVCTPPEAPNTSLVPSPCLWL